MKDQIKLIVKDLNAENVSKRLNLKASRLKIRIKKVERLNT